MRRKIHQTREIVFIPQKQATNGRTCVRTIDRRLIAREYLRTWFIVDFVSTVPLDTIFSELVLNPDALRGTKLIRMIRLIRLFKIFRLLKVGESFPHGTKGAACSFLPGDHCDKATATKSAAAVVTTKHRRQHLHHHEQQIQQQQTFPSQLRRF